MWRVNKDKMEAATGRAWPNFGWSQRALHTREHVLKEFRQVFVDDRPFHRDAINRHANVQSKSVSSYAMTVMGVIWVCGEAFEEHEWVSELTISMQEGRSVGGSGLRNRYPMRGAVEHVEGSQRPRG